MTELLEYIQFVLAPQMITGLALGIAVVLVALGLTIIFGLLDVINMAHGEFYAVGAYVALALGASGVSFWLLLVIVPLIMVPIGYAVERGLIQRVFNTPDRHVTTLLLTFGLGLVIEEALKIVFGPNTQRPPTPIPGAIEVMGVILPIYRLFLIVVGAAIVAAVAIVINMTRLGAIVRAAAFDRNSVTRCACEAGFCRYLRVRCCACRSCGCAAGADIFGVSDHGTRLHFSGFHRGDCRRHGLDCRRRGCWTPDYPGAGSIKPRRFAGVERSDRVRHHGACSRHQAAGPVRAARPCMMGPWFK